MADKNSSSHHSCASKLAASVLIAVNFITMVFCSLLFAFSLWMVASPKTLSLAIQAVGGKTLTVKILLLIVKIRHKANFRFHVVMHAIQALLPPESLSVQSGVGIAVVAIFIFFIAFLGFYGALCRSQFLLFMYSTLVMLLLLLEWALIYYFTSNIIEKGLRVEDGSWAHYTRIAFGCCDFNTSRFLDGAEPPWSCCGTGFYPHNCTIPDTYPKDCKPTISNWLDVYGTAIYAILAVFHIILSSCSIVRRSRSSSRSHS